MKSYVDTTTNFIRRDKRLVFNASSTAYSSAGELRKSVHKPEAVKETPVIESVRTVLFNERGEGFNG